MVRVNVLEVSSLSDQHLIAENLELKMLLTFISKHPVIRDMPERFKLGPGHMNFFKDKVYYVVQRRKAVQKELIRRSFNIVQDTAEHFQKRPIPVENLGNWDPREEDFTKLKERIIKRLQFRTTFYTFERKAISTPELISLIKKAKPEYYPNALELFD